jgi:hypothetical protein
VSKPNRALGGQRFAEQDSIDAGDEPHEPLSPRLNRAQAQIVAIESQKVEGYERGLS